MNHLSDDGLDPYWEDSIDPVQTKKKRQHFTTVIVLTIAGLLSATFAANISLSGGRVEFGQGTFLIRACDQWVAVTPTASAAIYDGQSRVASLKIIGLDAKRCAGSNIRIQAYTNDSATALNLFTGKRDDSTTGNVDWVTLKARLIVPSSFSCENEYNVYAANAVSIVDKTETNKSFDDTFHSIVYDTMTASYTVSFVSPLASVGSIDNITIQSYSITSSDPSYTSGFCIQALDIPQDGLQLYLDASNPTSYSGTGTIWRDLSSNGRDFTWNTSTNFVSSPIKSFNTLQALARGPASNSFGITDNSGYTILIVFKQYTLQASNGFTFICEGCTNGRGISAHTTWSDGKVYWDQGGCCDGARRTAVALESSTATWHVLALRNNTSPPSRQIWDGADLRTTNTETGTALNLSPTQLAVVGDKDRTTAGWDAQISQFVVYNRSLTNTERSDVIATLKAKVGLT